MLFVLIFQKSEYDVSCKLSPMETICMKCQIMFSGKNKKNIINLSSAELAQRVVKVKLCNSKWCLFDPIIKVNVYKF